MVMILIPLTTFGLYPLLGRLGFEPRPLRRMTLGMLTAGFAFVAVGFLQMRIDALAAHGAKLHVGWQLIPYFIITLAEVMVSITGLEFAYSQAPKKMKSVIMGFWLLNVTIGNLLVALLAGLQGPAAGQLLLRLRRPDDGRAALLFGLRAAFYKLSRLHAVRPAVSGARRRGAEPRNFSTTDHRDTEGARSRT
jgi:hypothetical protein